MIIKTIPELISNSGRTYEGDLRKYFKIVFYESSNRFHPYHNVRHMLHVTWECYDGGIFCGLEPRALRNLLIAALFHDFNHSGQLTGNDDLEIERAIRGLRKHILPVDEPFLESIESDIRATQFPYVVSESDISLSAKILRDSDVSQGLSSVWVQQILFGLSAEMRITPEALLAEQEKFLSSARFITAWGKGRFEHARDQRILEAKALLEILV